MINYYVIENEYTEENKRTYERKNVDFFWQVYDMDSDELVGEVADIGMQGFRLIGDISIAIGKIYRFRMEVSLQSDNKEQIELDALCVWQSKKLNPGRFTAGYKFLDLPADASQHIKNIIDTIISEI